MKGPIMVPLQAEIVCGASMLYPESVQASHLTSPSGLSASNLHLETVLHGYSRSFVSVPTQYLAGNVNKGAN